MRIISGKYRGRNLIAPEGLNTRPTLDRVKEAMFSVLNFRLQNAVTLDLFAGSGALSIEAISRGAKKAYINDLSNEAIKCIKKNIANAKIEEEIIITNKSYEEVLNSLNEKIDILFLDPPYKMDVYEEVVDYLINNDLLKEYAYLVLEMDASLKPLEKDGFTYKIYKYGNKKLQIMKRI
ncbi:MAG: 16S rRNA (guanine(966)-N(2))-methyltransferase RsmD [Bacilli bacterium]|nr:16S rRNA (guanine(966)-N(2))-methyltransferase RsmD [Bacilli bacterium]